MRDVYGEVRRLGPDHAVAVWSGHADLDLWVWVAQRVGQDHAVLVDLWGRDSFGSFQFLARRWAFLQAGDEPGLVEVRGPWATLLEGVACRPVRVSVERVAAHLARLGAWA